MTAPAGRRLACRSHAANGLHAPSDGPDGLCTPCRGKEAGHLFQSLGKASPGPGPDPVRSAAAREAGRRSHERVIQDAAARHAEYRRLRGEGLSIRAAAAEVGITAKTARRSYEPELTAAEEAT